MTVGTRAQLFQSHMYRTVRRQGQAVDLQGAAANLFSVDGIAEVYYMFGVVTTLIGAGLAVPRLQFTPTESGAQVGLCAAAASIATDVAGTIYTWTGLIAGQLTPGAVLGISDVNANADWAGGFITLTAGIIQLTNAVDALAGVIDWYIMYLPQLPGTVITPA